MGRQQITIEDKSPIINDKTGGAAGGGGNGALINRPVPLPKAGWQPYAPVETPGINPNLPKVPGPVRQSHNAAVTAKAGNKAHAAVLMPGHTENLQCLIAYAVMNLMLNIQPQPLIHKQHKTGCQYSC